MLSSSLLLLSRSLLTRSLHVLVGFRVNGERVAEEGRGYYRAVHAARTALSNTRTCGLKQRQHLVIVAAAEQQLLLLLLLSHSRL